MEKSFNTKALTTTSILISLGTITSFIKLFPMAFGGSVTAFSMFFIVLIGYLYGLKVGIVGGFVFGIIQFIINPWFLSPVQVAIDYLFAFSALGIGSIFRNTGKYSLHTTYFTGVFGRFFFAVLSGYFFYSSNTPLGQSALFYSIVYNGTYLFTEAFLTLIIISIFNKYKILQNY